MTICKYYGGSTLKGVATPTSDLDERGLVLNTDPRYILGTKRFDQEVINTTEQDVNYTELRKFMEYLSKGVFNFLEILFLTEKDLLVTSDILVELQTYRYELINIDKCFGKAMGFIKAHRYKAIVDDVVNIKAAYSVLSVKESLLPLLNNGDYKIKLDHTDHAAKLKLGIENYTSGKLSTILDEAILELTDAYLADKAKCVFNEKLANDLLIKNYLPYLT